MKQSSLDERVCSIHTVLHQGRKHWPWREIRGHVQSEIWRAVVVPAETYYEIWGRVNDA